jgi:hypothetical protein
MSTSTLIEFFGGFMAACFPLWLVAVGIPSPRRVLGTGLAAVLPAVLELLLLCGELLQEALHIKEAMDEVTDGDWREALVVGAQGLAWG